MLSHQLMSKVELAWEELVLDTRSKFALNVLVILVIVVPGISSGVIKRPSYYVKQTLYESSVGHNTGRSLSLII